MRKTGLIPAMLAAAVIAGHAEAAKQPILEDLSAGELLNLCRADKKDIGEDNLRPFIKNFKKRVNTALTVTPEKLKQDGTAILNRHISKLESFSGAFNNVKFSDLEQLIEASKKLAGFFDILRGAGNALSEAVRCRTIALPDFIGGGCDDIAEDITKCEPFDLTLAPQLIESRVRITNFTEAIKWAKTQGFVCDPDIRNYPITGSDGNSVATELDLCREGIKSDKSRHNFDKPSWATDEPIMLSQKEFIAEKAAMASRVKDMLLRLKAAKSRLKEHK